jgi:3-hydroxymyristoyl/3-hydroxydecanoyl-(acyl carrier protein) dehydratase
VAVADEARLTFPADHPAFPGHFPGDPMVPGALLLDEALAAVCAARGLAYESLRVGSAKFLRPVRPGQEVVVRWRDSGPGLLDLGLFAADRPVATATVSSRLSPP